MADKKSTKRYHKRKKGDPQSKLDIYLKNIQLQQSHAKGGRVGLLQGGRPKLATKGWK